MRSRSPGTSFRSYTQSYLLSLAILSFPWSFSVLGMVPGVIVTITIAASVQYTSLILWRFCLKHPEIRDVCDIGKMLFGGSQIAYNITAVFFLLNNTFIQGGQRSCQLIVLVINNSLSALHCLVGAELLNTLSNGAICTIGFSAITAFICFFISLPRTLAGLSSLGIFSAVTMGIAVLLAMIFAGVQDHPAGYILGSEPIVTAIPVKGTTYVLGMSAFLNITYTFVGQITIPSVSTAGLVFVLDLKADVSRSSSLRCASQRTSPRPSGPSPSPRFSSSPSAARSCTITSATST